MPFILPQLHEFFAPSLINPDAPAHQGWFSFEGVPLKWHFPVGLLYDLFSGAEPAGQGVTSPQKRANEYSKGILPWKLTAHFTEWPSDQLIPLDPAWKSTNDAYMNSVKEADCLRNGATVIKALSKEDSGTLWESLKDHDLTKFNSINRKFLNPPGGSSIRHVPMKIYLPTTPIANEGTETQARGTVRTVQGLFPPTISPKEPQTLGTALHGLLPKLFQRRSYIHALATLHGVVVPPSANLLELMQVAAYADGFLHVVVCMINYSS